MRKTCLKAKIDQECGDAIMDDITNGLSEDSVSIVKSSVIKTSEQISGKAKDCKKLENERKILEFHKYVYYRIVMFLEYNGDRQCVILLCNS